MGANAIQSTEGREANPYQGKPVISADERLRALCEPTCPEKVAGHIAEKPRYVKSDSKDSLFDLFRRKLSFGQATVAVHSS